MTNDLIKRSDAIKAIMDLPNTENGYSGTYDKQTVIDFIEDVPSVNQWIKCSDRLPRKSGLYLIVPKHITEWVVYLAYYSESKMLLARPDDVISTMRDVYIKHGAEPSLIEAWMPLPIYEEEK